MEELRKMFTGVILTPKPVEEMDARSCHASLHLNATMPMSRATPLSCVFVVAYGKYLLKAAQQVYSTTQRERDIKFIIFKRTYFVESFQREPNSLWSTFDHQLHNFVTNGISTDEHTFPKK